jgi:hypothetical protein
MLDTRITVVVVLPMVHVFSTQTVAEFYRRRSNANLDKSDLERKLTGIIFNFLSLQLYTFSWL